MIWQHILYIYLILGLGVWLKTIFNIPTKELRKFTAFYWIVGLILTVLIWPIDLWDDRHWVNR